MATDIGKFKTTITNMMDEIKKWIPSDRDLETQCFLVESALKINPRATITEYMSNVEPYAKHIMDGNDAYFINNVESLLDSEYKAFSSKIRTIWISLDNIQKNTLKKYSKLLLILGTIITHNEPLRLLINTYRDKSNPLLFS